MNMNFEVAKNILLSQNINHPAMNEAASFIASDISLCNRLADEANLGIRAVIVWGLIEIDYPDGWSFLAPLNDRSMLVH